MKICMIGAGYVGLVSAACFSEFGWKVTCIDKDPAKIDLLNEGHVPIYEPRLDELLERNLRMGRISFSTDLAKPVADAELVFLAVGTPMRRGDGHADLSFVFQAVEDLAPHLKGFTVITTKSTVPVGTSREIEKRLRALRPDAEFAVCSNPEFLREGSAIYDFTHPDRVLVGCDDDRAREVMKRLYKPLALRNAPVMFVSRELAELAKYAANAFLAMKISFINEVADLCEAVDADVQEVATAIGADGRIGNKFLHPGPGYGGSCFPKDVAALIRIAREACSPLSLIEQVQTVNSERKIAMAKRIEHAAGGSVAGKTVAGARNCIQTGYRRYPRGAKPHRRAHAPGKGRDRPRLRSACTGECRGAAAWCGLVRKRARGRRAGRCRGGADRVERVPGAEPRDFAIAHARRRPR